ncbi:MAG: hypothetical protein H0W88_04575 [Parachlamydiaceae bacterium]|nr:hypothetical protein [Parachlamydiaceae bacterium]
MDINIRIDPDNERFIFTDEKMLLANQKAKQKDVEVESCDIKDDEVLKRTHKRHHRDMKKFGIVQKAIVEAQRNIPLSTPPTTGPFGVTRPPTPKKFG